MAFVKSPISIRYYNYDRTTHSYHNLPKRKGSDFMTVSKAKEICNGCTNSITDRFSSKARYLKMKSESMSHVVNGNINDDMKSMLNSIFKIGDFAISHN